MAKAVTAAEKAAEKRTYEWAKDQHERVHSGKPSRSFAEWDAGVEPCEDEKPNKKKKAKN